jgi:hypothetical protein
VSGLKVQGEIGENQKAPDVSFTKFVDFEDKVSHYIRDPDAIGGPIVTKTLSEDSAVPAGVWMANGVGAVLALSALVYMKFADEKSPLMGLSAIVCYIALSCLVDMNINAAGNGKGVKFEAACSVLLVELGKLVMSAVLYTANRLQPMRDGEGYLQESFRAKDVMFLAVPGGLFALNNILIYVSIGMNDMASFGVFRDTTIFFNAMMWCWVFQSSLGLTRMLTLGFVFAGLCINQIGPMMNASLSASVLLVLAMTLTNACASVANEFAIKQNSQLDLNMQNAVLYSFCSMFALAYIIILHPERMTSLDSFFANFDTLAWLLVAVQLCIGLLVSRILKYADSVSKAVGSCLRGPIVVFLAPLVGLHSRLDFLTGTSAVIVATGACYFLMQGRPAPGVDLSKAEK